LHIWLLALTDEQILESPVFIGCFERFALENQDWLHITIHSSRALKVGSAFEVFDSDFEEVECMAIENTPNH